MKKLINWKRVVSVGLIFCNVAMISVPTLAVSSPKESTVQIEEISYAIGCYVKLQLLFRLLQMVN